jgi:hypothetical protein
MKKPCILFLFNSSMYAMDPWLQAGHRCVTVDWNDTDHSAHRKPPETLEGLDRLSIDLSTGDALGTLQEALGALGVTPRLVVSFAPCTDLAVSGAAHFSKKRALNPLFQTKAVSMATLATGLGIPYVIENPVSVLATLWRKPCAYVNPKDFGGYLPEEDIHPEEPNLFPPRDAYNKKTGLWTGNGFILPVPMPVEEKESAFPCHRALGGKSARTKHLRSLTPRGLSMAIYVANKQLLSV